MSRRHLDQKKYSKALGLRIRELRNAKGWTLEQCEEHGELRWRHLQQIESGRNFTIYTLVNLANLFGMSPDEILEGV